MNRKRSDTDEQRDERRFDTTSLLQGVEASDASLDDILQEFGSVTVKPAPLTAGGKPHVEDSRAYADADTIWASLEAEIREEIDADRAAAAKAAAAEPAAGKATKPAAVKPTAGTAAKSAAAEPAGGTAAPAQRTQTAQQQPAQTAQTAQKNTAAGSRTAAQSGQTEKPPLSGAETLRASRFHFVELDLRAEPAPLQQQVQSPQQTVQSAQRSVQTQKTGQTARKSVQAQEAGQTAQKPEQAQKAGQAARKPEQAQKAGQTARKPVQAERTARAEKSTAGRRTQAAASV